MSLTVSVFVSTTLWLAALGLIGRGYTRTKNTGWLWLGASVLWSKLVTFIAHTWLRRIEVGTNPTIMNVIGLLEEITGMTLFLLAIINLSKRQSLRDASAV